MKSSSRLTNTLKKNNIRYFDYSATTFMSQNVIDEWIKVNTECGISIGRGSSFLSKKADKIFKESTDRLLSFFGLKDKYLNLYFKNVTEAINIVAMGLEHLLKPLDIILVGPFEHHSNYLPWKYIAKKTGALFFEIPVDSNYELDYSFIERYKDKIKILSVSSVSNAFGYKLNIDKICKLIDKDTLFLVDDSQLVAHEKINTNNKIAVHFLPSHKMYGPKNIAASAVRKDIINVIKPVILGGGMVDNVSFEDSWLKDEKKFLSGTIDISLIAAWAGATTFLEKNNYLDDTNTKKFNKMIIDTLNECGYQVISNNKCVPYVISFVHPKIHAHDVSEYLSNKNIVIRSGNLCSQNTIRKIETNAINRISLGIDTTLDDVKELCSELKQITKIRYSSIVNKYLNLKLNDIVIPDIITVKDGISCGDRILLSAQADDEVLRFNFGTDDCCSLSKAACNYIQYNFNKKNIDYIKKEIDKILNRHKKDNNYLFDMFGLKYNKYYKREDCLLSPFEFFSNLLNEIRNVDYVFENRPDTLKTLACDACVGTCRINWEQKEVLKKDHHQGKVFTTDYLSKWIPLGKIELNDKEIESLKESLKDITSDDMQFLSDYTMNGFVLTHVLKYCPELVDSNWKAPAYLIQKNEINKNYFEEVKKYIANNNLDIYSVKGYVTQKYYDNPMIRVHSDYDLISTNSKDAFILTNHLLKEGFTIRPNLFSYKKMNYNGEEIISGHFHVQKIIDDMYMFELDITFPGFPINRVDLFFPKVIDYNIRVEGQIIVTLLHLFKHEHVYIKDINDLFYMLKENIDYDYLKSLLKEYKLEKFFKITLEYINNNYKSFHSYYKILSKEFNVKGDLLKSYPLWPYDLDMHLKIKQEDLDERTAKIKENDRKYLFPVVVFKELFDFKVINDNIIKKYNIKLIEDSIYEVNYKDYIFYLTPIGLFIDNYIDTKNRTRNKYIEIIEEFLKEINIKELFNVSYAYNHFYVRVI